MQLINNISNNKNNSASHDLSEIKVNFADSWEYYREITINPSTPEADYQIRIDLNPSIFNYSRAKSDGSDIRFYNSNQIILDYWIESWDDTGNSIIWVKIPTSGTSAIYMYYGNPTATSLSNGTNTFIFFDDFLGSSLDSAKWDTEIGTYCGITVSSGYVRLYSQAPSAFVERAYMGFSESYFIQGTPYSWIHPSQNAEISLAEDPSWFIEELHWTNLSSAPFFKDDVFDAEDTTLEDTTLPVKYIAQSVHGITGGPWGAWIWTDDDTFGQLGRGLRTRVWVDLTNIADFRVDWVAVFEYNESNPNISISSEMLNYSNENEPFLSEGFASPSIGDQNTKITFSVNYTDFDNNQPDFVDVIVNGNAFMMTKLNSSDTNYTDGCIYEFSTYLMPSAYNYTYMFNCSDGIYYNSTTIFNDLEVFETNNDEPHLQTPQVSPERGTDITNFNFSVWYYDDDNNLPHYLNITINQTIYLMEKFDPIDNNATNGILYYYNTTLDFGYYQFQFNCSDGKFENSTSWISNPEVNPFYYGADITLLNPINSSSLFTDWINFEWSSLAASFGNVNYTLQISNTSDFSSLIFEQVNIEEEPETTNTSVYLSFDTGIYFWRIRPQFESFTGNWSSFFIFDLATNYFTPSLNLCSITPTQGDQYTLFNFTVSYIDQDNNSPLYLNVIINGSSHVMEKVNSLDTEFTDGCVYQYLTTLPYASHNYTYSFNCSDGKYLYSSMVFNNLEVNPANNFVPQLLNPQVSPERGGLITTFDFTVWYFDEDDNLPTFVNITIDDTEFSMIQFDPSDINAIDGILFYFNTTLNIGFHSFQVNCSDSSFLNSTDLIVGPEVNPLYDHAPIILLNPINNAELPADWINFSWISLNASFGIVNYTLQISDTDNFAAILYEVTNIQETTDLTEVQLDINLPTGIHYWRVRPTFSIFNGDWSNNFKLNIIRNDYAPILISDTLFPTSGNQNTVFKFTGTYKDLDNNAPVFIKIIINGKAYSMEKENPNDNDYTDGCIYQFLTLLPPSEEAYAYSLECSDGVFYDSTSTFEGPAVYSDIPIYDRNEGLNNRDSEYVLALSISLIIGIGIVVPSILLTEIKSKKIKLKSTIKSKTGLKAKKSINKKN